MVTEHTCKPDQAINEVQICLARAKKRARAEENLAVRMSSIY